MYMLIIHRPGREVALNSLLEKFSDVVKTRDVIFVSTFAEARAECEKALPTMIISYAQLEDDNAFNFCTRLRLINDAQMIPYIIVTDQPNDQDKLKAFQVGADDYLSTGNAEYFWLSIGRLIKDYQSHQLLMEEKSQADKLVNMAMKSSAELGASIHFIERCHQFSSYEQVAEELIDHLSQLNLSIVVGIMTQRKMAYWASTKNVSPLERELMSTIHETERLVDFGGRTQFNWPNLCVLVKNMPVKDPEYYGRIKDLLPPLLSSANVRIHAIAEQKHVHEQTELMVQSIQMLQPELKNIEVALDNDSRMHRDALSEFLQNIIMELPKLGLDSDQEDFFVSRVEQLIAESEENIKKNQQHCSVLSNTSEVLMMLLTKQKELESFIDQPVEIADKPSNSESNTFELF